MFFYARWSGGAHRSDSDRGKGGAGIAIVIAVALIALAWFLSVVIRFALSREREYLADAGSVELTKNPDAMISALRKIENRGELRRRHLRRHGDVRRQSARGHPGPVRHASPGGRPRRCAGALRGRTRSGPARGAAIRPDRGTARATGGGAGAAARRRRGAMGPGQLWRQAVSSVTFADRSHHIAARIVG